MVNNADHLRCIELRIDSSQKNRKRLKDYPITWHGHRDTTNVVCHGQD